MPERVSGLTVTINGNKPTSISDQVIAAVMEQAEQIDRSPFADIAIKVQDGKPVMVEITTKHKPGNTNTEQTAPKVWANMTPWDKCRVPEPTMQMLTEQACTGGLDVSNQNGIASVVLYFPPTGGERVAAAVVPFFWIYEHSIPELQRRYHWPVWEWAAKGYITVVERNTDILDMVVKRILELRQPYCILDVGVDALSGARAADQLVRAGLLTTYVRRGTATLSQPMKELRRLIGMNKLGHDGNPILKAMVSNLVVTQDAQGNEKPDPANSEGPIGGVIALLDAMSRALVHTNKETTAP